MLPHGHLAIGYVLSSLYVRIRTGETLDWISVGLVIIGTQLPDAIDKPLWWIGVLPTGRALGHSLLFAVPLCALVTLTVRRHTGEVIPGIAFTVSYCSALLADGSLFLIHGTVARDLVEVSFWVWPFSLPADRIVSYLVSVPLVSTFVEQKAAWATATFPTGNALKLWIRASEVIVILLAGLLWMLDGKPGLERLRAVRDAK